MERNSYKKSTLIDPASLNMPQIAVVDNEGRPIRDGDGAMGLGRQPTMGNKRASNGPLLDFGDSPAGGLSPPGTRPGIKTRGSVFGVDTLWEKEVSKLERMKQADIQADAEEERLRDEETRKWNSKKGKGREKSGKRGQSTLGRAGDEENQSPGASGAQHPGSPGAPILPDISRVSTSGRPRAAPVRDDFSDDDGMAEFGAGAVTKERRRASTATLGVKGWFAGGSDDEDDASRRSPDSRALTPNSASPYPRGSLSPAGRLAPVIDQDDEDEDVPLVAKMNQIRASVFARPQQAADDSDEDAPLVNLKAKPRNSDGAELPIASSNLTAPENPPQKTSSDEDEDEDNVPLGLRASSLFPSTLNIPSANPAAASGAAGGGASSDEDEDEKPLGLRYSMAPADQQQQQYSTLMQQQQQQQQQQMYMQHMAHSSMASFSAMGAFGPMGMGSIGPGSFMAPQMTGGSMAMGMGMGMPMPMQMQMPMTLPTPAIPNPADAAKINRVDNWRKGVEGGVPDHA